MNIFQIDDIITRTRRGRKFEQDGLAPLGRFHTINFFQLLDPALDLRRVRSSGLEPFNKFYFLGQHGLLPFELRLLLLFIQSALLFIKFVIARIGRQ